MLISTAIDFYIDDQNRAIPASMATSYLLSDAEAFEALFEALEEQLTEASNPPLDHFTQRHLSRPWLGIAAAFAGTTSLGMLWASYQPGLTFPFTPANAHLTENLNAEAVQTQSMVLPRQAQIAAPESTAKPIFSHQSNRLHKTTGTHLFHQAKSFSYQAMQFTKTAQSVDDWQMVAHQWQKAIAMLSSVPRTHANYAAAQQQLAQYRLMLRQAQQKANQPVVEAPLPMTTVYSPALEKAKQAANQPAAQPVMATAEPATAGNPAAASQVPANSPIAKVTPATE